MEEKLEMINKTQKKLDEILSRGDNYDYDEIIINLCENLVSQLGHDLSTYPVKRSIEIIDIYYECLYHFWVMNRKIRFPLKLLIMLMSYRNIIYYSILLTKTYEDGKKWREQIYEEIYDMFGNDKPYSINKFVELIKLSDIDIENTSAITYFHYFVGFKFNKKYIGIDKETLLKYIGKYDSIIFINITYNSKFHNDSVYVYRDIDTKFGEKLIDKESIEKFKPMFPVEISNKPTSLVTIDGNIGDVNFVVINYNNEYFTILSNNEEILKFNKFETEKFINGGIPNFITNEEYLDHAKLMFFQSINRVIAPININESTELGSILPDHRNIYRKIQPILDFYINNNDLNNKNTFHSMIQEINEKIDVEEVRMEPEGRSDGTGCLMDENDKKLFIFYLDMYEFEEFRKQEFVSYLFSYLNPSEIDLY